MGTSENKPSQQGNLCVFMLRNDEGASMEGRTAKMKCETGAKVACSRLSLCSCFCRDKKKSCFLFNVCARVMSTVWMFYVLIPDRKSENHHPRWAVCPYDFLKCL